MSILPQLEHDLQSAARRRLAPADQQRPHEASRRKRRRARGALAFGASGLVVAVVAVGALLLLGHRASRPSVASSAAVSRSALISSLALLRRPRTAADRGAQLLGPLGVLDGARRGSGVRSLITARGNPKAEPLLQRIVDLNTLDAQALIVPVTYRPRGGSTQRIQGLLVQLQIAHGGAGIGPVSATSFLNHGIAISTTASRDHNRSVHALLVPDGVARVQLGTPQLSPGAVRSLGRDQLPERVVRTALRRATPLTVGVKTNLASWSTAQPTVHVARGISGDYGYIVHLPETWYSTSGTVLRRTTLSESVAITIKARAKPRRRSERGTASNSRFCRENPSACAASTTH